MSALDAALAGDERAALTAWAAVAEPGDEPARTIVEQLGASGALAWVRDCRSDPVSATQRLLGGSDPARVDAAVKATERWLPRLAEADPIAAQRRGRAVGARIITRADDAWPGALDALGAQRPFALWVRGGGDLAALFERAIAIVGSRASTAYGEHVAADLAGGVGDSGWCVVSGGAYGIDAAAHRAALSTATPTVAVMAGGVDRLYPAGHTDLLTAVLETGAVVSEVPVGFAPHRSRFLARNRIIAAAGATCVVEAAIRSGALSTARHALECGKPVGAVPGPVTSVGSSGCHRLIRDGEAVLVTDAAQLLELAGPIGADPAPDTGEGFADPQQRRAYDAIGIRGASVDRVAKGAGLTVGEALKALGALEFAGLARSESGLWRRRR